MALTKDTTKTIKPTFDFTVSPPTTGDGEVHENYDPTTGEYPTMRDNLSADKFNALEDAINNITDYLGDMDTNFGNLTVGSKIRKLENDIIGATLSTQLYYIMSTIGGGVLPGDINSNTYSENIVNGKFDVQSTITGESQGFSLTINPGGGLVGSKSSNTNKLVRTEDADVSIDEAPTYSIGTPDATGDPSGWTQDGELHTVIDGGSFYLDHRFLKTTCIPFTGAFFGSNDLATVVAVKKDNSAISAEAKPTTFGVDLTTGRVWDKGFFATYSGEDFYFYYKHYGWRVDSIYAEYSDAGEHQIKVEAGTGVEELKDITTTAMGIKNSYSSLTEIPAYFVLITPQNNISETTTQLCYVSSEIKNCGYARVPSANENIIDIRRFISVLGKTKKRTNGLMGKRNNILNVDTTKNYVEMDALRMGVSGIPSTYDSSQKLIIMPESYFINDVPIETKAKVVDIPTTSGYLATPIYVDYPDGDVVLGTGAPNVADIDDLEEPEESDYAYMGKVGTVIAANDAIDRVIPAQSSCEFIPPVVGTGKIGGATKELIVSHNIGCEYVAVAYPLEAPIGTYPHVIVDYINNNVTRFLYDNNGRDLYVYYTIIPTYGNDYIIPMDTATVDENNKIYFYHGCFKNSRVAYSIAGETTDNITSEIGWPAITKGFSKDTITLGQSGGSSFSWKGTRVIDDLIDSHNKSTDVSLLSYANIGGTTFLSRQVGIIINFLYDVDDTYWLDIDPAVGSIVLNFSTSQPTSSYIDSIVLK